MIHELNPTPDPTPTPDPSRTYDDAILAWRAARTPKNYEALEQAHLAYYAGIGRYAGGTPEPSHAGVGS